MFHVRRIITQSNLGVLKHSKSNLIKFNYSTDNTKDSDRHPNLPKGGIDFETLIRIDHTETEEQKKVKLSESCIKRLKELGNSDKYLRITVDSGGCSGFEYKFSLDKLTEEDKIIEQDNCKVLVDKETEDFIKGATIDYYEELIRSGFRITNNPNSEQGCSCGSSFSVKI